MHVYIVEEQFNDEPTGLLKIGKADDPKQRLIKLRTGNPRQLVLRYSFPCGELASKVEKIAHKTLKPHLVYGEWFSISSDHAHACIQAIITEQTAASNQGKDKFIGQPIIGNMSSPPVNARVPVSSLRKLPIVFKLEDVQTTLGVGHDYAERLLERWVTASKVDVIGPYADEYYNRSLYRDGPTPRFEEIHRKLLGRPFVGIGPASLFFHEWTTRLAWWTDVAVLTHRDQGAIPSIEGMGAVGRPESWFKTVLPKCQIGHYGFPVAPPEFALVEAIMSRGEGGTWMPDPDEIEVPWKSDPADSVRRIEEAAAALNADIDRVREYIGWVDAFRDISPSP